MNYSGQTAKVCRARGCSNRAAVGAHVQKDVLYNNKWYIVPFCSSHNAMASSTRIELVAWTSLVRANIKETCGK